MTHGDRIAMQALDLIAELYVEWEPEAQTAREGDILREGFALVQAEHPCGECRESWRTQAEPCAAHRVQTQRRQARAQERESLLALLERHGWRRGEVADALGVTRRTLLNRMTRVGLMAPSARTSGEENGR